MSTFVGIDLGTTNSVVAYRNAYGRPEVIANREGQNVTPSVVYFGADPPAVGQEAKEWARAESISEIAWTLTVQLAGVAPVPTVR